MKKIILILATVLTMNAALAETMVVAGVGAGDDSCGMWLKGRREDEQVPVAMITSWMQGYLSGLNQARIPADYLQVPATSVLLAWLDKECGADPTKRVFYISVSLSVKLAKDQGKSLPFPAFTK